MIILKINLVRFYNYEKLLKLNREKNSNSNNNIIENIFFFGSLIFLNMLLRMSLFFFIVFRVSCFFSNFGEGFLFFFLIILLINIFVVFEFVILFLSSVLLLEWSKGFFWFENVLVWEVIVFLRIDEIKLFLDELIVLVFVIGWCFLFNFFLFWSRWSFASCGFIKFFDDFFDLCILLFFLLCFRFISWWLGNILFVFIFWFDKFLLGGILLLIGFVRGFLFWFILLGYRIGGVFCCFFLFFGELGLLFIGDFLRDWGFVMVLFIFVSLIIIRWKIKRKINLLLNVIN